MSNEHGLGPIWGVPLIDVLPLNPDKLEGIRQQMPSRDDLDGVHCCNGIGDRIVAGYEVLLHHWRARGEEIERLSKILSHYEEEAILPDDVDEIEEAAVEAATAEKATEIERLRAELNLIWDVIRESHISYDDSLSSAEKIKVLVEQLHEARNQIEWLKVEAKRLRRIVGSVVRNCRHVDDTTPRDEPGPLAGPTWAKVAYMCGLGSTSASSLCREFNVDPNSRWTEDGLQSE